MSLLWHCCDTISLAVTFIAILFLTGRRAWQCGICMRRSLRPYLSLLLLSISTNPIKPTQIFCTKSLQPLCKGLIHRTLPAVFHTNNPLPATPLHHGIYQYHLLPRGQPHKNCSPPGLNPQPNNLPPRSPLALP